MWYKRPVYKITERRDGKIFSTVKVASVWLAIESRTPEQEAEIAKQYGGDILASPENHSTDYRYGGPKPTN